MSSKDYKDIVNKNESPAHKELISKMMLGKIFEDMTQEQLDASKQDFSVVLIQLNAALICIEEALSELDKIPNGKKFVASFTLMLMRIQLMGITNQFQDAQDALHNKK